MPLKRKHHRGTDAVLLYAGMVEVVQSAHVVYAHGVEDVLDAHACFHVRFFSHLIRSFGEEEQALAVR